MRKSVLVTGGAGFIGSEFVRQLTESEDFEEIFVVDSLTYAGDISRIKKQIDSKQIEFIHADINESTLYLSAMSQVDYVVHFAAESHVDRSNENGLPFIESNVTGTYKLLESARTFPTVRTILVSTDEVYGSIKDGEFSESNSLNPSSVYSASKTAGDLFGLAMHHTFSQDVVITRGCNTYGPHQHQEKLIPKTISNLLSGKKVPLYGNGLNTREWIHVFDHANAIKSVMLKGKSGQIYNVGSGNRMTNSEVIEVILKELNLSWDYVEFIEDRPGHDQRYALNSKKIRDEINWFPIKDFSEGILETISWHMKSESFK